MFDHSYILLEVSKCSFVLCFVALVGCKENNSSIKTAALKCGKSGTIEIESYPIDSTTWRYNYLVVDSRGKTLAKGLLGTGVCRSIEDAYKVLGRESRFVVFEFPKHADLCSLPNRGQGETWASRLLTEKANFLVDFSVGTVFHSSDVQGEISEAATQLVKQLDVSAEQKLEDAIWKLQVASNDEEADLVGISSLSSLRIVVSARPLSAADVSELNKLRRDVQLHLEGAKLTDSDLLPLHKLQCVSAIYLPNSGINTKALDALREKHATIPVVQDDDAD